MMSAMSIPLWLLSRRADLGQRDRAQRAKTLDNGYQNRTQGLTGSEGLTRGRQVGLLDTVASPCRDHVDDIVLVSDEAMLEAARWI